MSKRGRRSARGVARQETRRQHHEQRQAWVDPGTDYQGSSSRWGVGLAVEPRHIRKAFKTAAPSGTVVIAGPVGVIQPTRVVGGVTYDSTGTAASRVPGGALNTGRRTAKSGPVEHAVRETRHVTRADENGNPVEVHERVTVAYEESELHRRRNAPAQTAIDPAKAYQRNGWVK